MPTDADAFFLFYILFSCFYFSFNYTFVEEVEMNPNQTKPRGSRYDRTNSKDIITCFLYFSLPGSCCRLTVCFILEDHSSTEGLLFKVWNTSVWNPGPLFFFLLCDPGEVFWLHCASFLIHNLGLWEPEFRDDWHKTVSPGSGRVFEFMDL